MNYYRNMRNREKQQQGLCVCGTVGGFEYLVDFSGNLKFL